MKSNFKILLVEDMASFREAATQMLSVYNDVIGAADLDSARVQLKRQTFDVVLLDKGLPDGNGMDLIPEIKESSPNTVVIVLTSDSDFSSVKHCISLGADDYVVKNENIIPDLLVRIPVAASKAASERRLISLDRQIKDAFKYEIVGKSQPIMELRETILSLKGTNASVLIMGESGTGKELIARRINAIEDNQKRPFVAINCGAIPEHLLESELFGHKKGSFTGAVNDRVGCFELAHQGDIFLDEIGEMPLTAQVRLLRVLQEGEVTRVGDNRTIKVNCRVITATNKNLLSLVEKGQFREDLYHRLNVVNIQISALRERMADIADLARLFTLQIGGSDFTISDHAIRALGQYGWPGNVRELRNTIERAIISTRRRSSKEIKYEDILIQNPNDDIGYKAKKIEALLPEKIKDLSPEKYKEFVDGAMAEYFKAALKVSGGNVADLATRIGIGRSTVFGKLKDLGVSLEDVTPDRPNRRFLKSTDRELNL
ncbi:MAG: sigma-54-dependent Fis family transcriptional regulator [Bdellovibrionales bacterium]|nr:sigma-54-dependent Fis family transcriptional regulator [Bdellovibrionales bacterium]